MKIIFSPAKKMRTDTDTMVCVGKPVFLDRTGEILSWMRGRSYDELRRIWECSEKIAQDNILRLEDMDIENGLTPAILSYEGIAYRYMAPVVFDDSCFEYVQEHLYILSAFYGILRAMDGVTPYRLEMKARAGIGEHPNMYEYWGDSLYNAMSADNSDNVIINLASREYSRCIERYLRPEDMYITVSFMERSGDRLITKGTYAKMARGEMVRYMAENHIENAREIKRFDRLGYSFSEDDSSDTEYVFVKGDM